MFPPLIFAPLYYLHRLNQKENTLQFKTIKWILFALVAIIVTGIVSLYFVDRISFVSNRYTKATILLFLGTAALYLLYAAPKFRLLYIFLMIIVFRIGFDFFILPDRNANDYANEVRMSSIKAAQKYADKTLYCPSEGLFRGNSYYLTRETKKIVKATNAVQDGLLISPRPRESCKKIDYIKSRNPSNDYLVLDCKE